MKGDVHRGEQLLLVLGEGCWALCCLLVMQCRVKSAGWLGVLHEDEDAASLVVQTAGCGCVLVDVCHSPLRMRRGALSTLETVLGSASAANATAGRE